MSELRQDRTSGAWVIVAPQRGQRPQMRAPGARSEPRPRFDPKCPFCPGHEAQLPGIIAETPAREVPGWSVRAVPNKFPAVPATLAAQALTCGGHQARPGQGAHEVIIESPWHDAEPATLSAVELNAAVETYRARSRTLLAQDGIAAVILFRNYGPRAGASLAHPHAQIIALDFVPPKLAAIDGWTRRYTAEHGRCAMCAELEVERASGTRIVGENDKFVALVPFAAEHPFELWVVPKQHEASFGALADKALPAFSDLLGRSLRLLQAALDDPPYNFVVDTAPKAELVAPHWHWKLRIVPDVATWGGFELGAGLPINPSSPEDDARVLRAAPAEHEGRS
jgi:UDPglucose--hexose-1-phosphate uridylyltransferase